MSARAKGFSVRIFVPHGDPDGLKIVEKSNWTGCGLVFPRALFADAKVRAELQRTGVYILLGPGESTPLDRVYIGEGDPIRPRLEDHAKRKDFWTKAVAFTSKDQNLNKAHVQYLEASLFQLADAAKLCELDNGNAPQPPSLSEADTAEAEVFLENILLCLPVLGVSVFERAHSNVSRNAELFIKSKGLEARGFEAAQGFVVRKDSQAVKDERMSSPKAVSDLRATLVAQGVLKLVKGAYLFTQDYPFTSPSTAASIVVGGSANGRITWKDAYGVTLKQLQEAEASR